MIADALSIVMVNKMPKLSRRVTGSDLRAKVRNREQHLIGIAMRRVMKRRGATAKL